MILPRPELAKPVNPSARTLKYETIRNWLSDRISSGEFACGAQLPSEHDIMAQFNVSRVTARQAFDALRQSGLVVAQRGKGYFVARLRADASLERLESFGEMMAPFGIETSSNVLELSEVPADEATAKALGVHREDTVTRLVRSRLAGHTVVSLDISHYPIKLGRRLMTLDLANQDVFLLLENHIGVELGYADVEIDVTQIDACYAPILDISSAEPVIRLLRKTHDNSGQTLAAEEIYARLDAMRFHARIPRW
ncbi:MAG: GntR family transcriptional regulator [Pseudomonadota bacterium]